jgi:hypothetical protein
VILGAWVGQLGVGGWVLMGLFWATFVGLVLWALSRLFVPVREDEVLQEGADDLDQRRERNQLDLSEYRTRGVASRGPLCTRNAPPPRVTETGERASASGSAPAGGYPRSFILRAGGSGRWIPALSRGWSH